MDRWIGFGRSLLVYNNPISRRAWRLFYEDVLAPGDVAFDIGAHVGTRARAMRAVGARVVAVEPQEPFASYLRRTLPGDIEVVPAAVGNLAGEREMAVSHRHPTVSSLQKDFVQSASGSPGFEKVQWNGSQSVQVVTMDDLISRYGTPDYVKIDVEGFESDVVAGLSEPVALLSTEYLPGFPSLSHQVIDRLENLGEYFFNPVSGETGRFMWPEWRDAAATREWLDLLTANERSGDLFARCDDVSSYEPRISSEKP